MLILLLSLAMAGYADDAYLNSGTLDLRSSDSIWAGAPGDGFSCGTKELNVGIAAGFGMRVITSRGTHDWVMGNLEYGCMFTELVGADHWYRGNWEILAQVFGGVQFYPDTAYVVGGGPIIRYNFATGRRLVPFLDLGGGAAATDIRNGDLSTTFEFNLQGGAGAHWFIRDNLALTLQYRFIHLSNAGIKFPNLGVNTSTFFGGVSWFF